MLIKVGKGENESQFLIVINLLGMHQTMTKSENNIFFEMYIITVQILPIVKEDILVYIFMYLLTAFFT